MGIAEYVLGLVWLACVLSPLALAAVFVRASRFAGWVGARARLVELIVVLVGLTLVAEILGSFGAFDRWPVAAASAVGGLAIAWAVARYDRSARPRFRGSVDRLQTSPIAVVNVLAFGAAGVTVARWIPGVITALQLGPPEADTQSYHLPHAARFIQDGWLTRLHFTTIGDTIPYHPSNAEIFHAYGMLAFGRDILSPVLNIGWLLAVFLAAWVVGERWRKGGLAVIGSAMLMGVPVMFSTQGGSAHTDVAAIALLLASIAMLVHADGRSAHVVLAGAAAGLALGSKFSMVVPVAFLTVVAAIVANRDGLKRLTFLTAWGVPLVACGSFWYLRNLIRVGNPVPSLRLGIGPLALPRIPMELIDKHGYSVADYAFDGQVWRDYFLPGLDLGFGGAWIVPFVLFGLGMVASVKAESPFAKILGPVGLGSALGWAFTPTTAFGLKGRPDFFLWNLRYLVPALLLSVLALVAWRGLVGWRAWAYIALCGAVGLVELNQGWEGRSYTTILLIFALVGLAGAGWVVARRWPRALVASAVVVSLVGVVAGYGVARAYIDRRYLAGQGAGPREPASVWGQHVRDSRIGVVGFFKNYPLHGADLSNRVDYVGELRTDNAFTDHRTCEAWRRAVNAGGYDYVVTMPSFGSLPEPPAARWTLTDPAAEQIAGNGKERVFSISAPLDPAGCSRRSDRREDDSARRSARPPTRS